MIAYLLMFNLFSAYVALSGEQFELSFDLPFNEYLPTTVALKFWIQVI